jgi:ribosomal protein L30
MPAKSTGGSKSKTTKKTATKKTAKTAKKATAKKATTKTATKTTKKKATATKTAKPAVATPAAATKAASAKAAPTKVHVKQIRSGIGRRRDLRRTLRALGLKHHQDEIVVTRNAAIDGMLTKVSHLIRVTPEE